MRVRSFAKVNLWLRVAGKRDDGFHELETVFHTVSLSDELTFEVHGSGIEIRMWRPPGPSTDLPEERENIVWSAATVLRDRKGVLAEIRKTIPIGAGLAGGSGNAAATLIALNELWDAGKARDELVDIAADLGSDVPFLLEGGTLLGWGRGEKLARMPDPPDLWFVLGISHSPLSTADVYRRWEPSEAPAPSLDEFRAALATHDPTVIALGLRNDLEAAALELRPELVAAKQALVAAGALGALVCGSGPTLFGLAIDEQHANDVAEGVRGVFDRVEVVRSQPRGVEVVER